MNITAEQRKQLETLATANYLKVNYYRGQIGLGIGGQYEVVYTPGATGRKWDYLLHRRDLAVKMKEILCP